MLLRRLAGQGQGTPKGAIAADGDQSIQPQQLAGSQSFFAAGGRQELLTAGRIEQRAALINGVTDAGGI